MEKELLGQTLSSSPLVFASGGSGASKNMASEVFKKIYIYGLRVQFPICSLLARDWTGDPSGFPLLVGPPGVPGPFTRGEVNAHPRFGAR